MMVSVKSFLEIVYKSLRKTLFSAPSSLPSALARMVTVVRAHLKLEVVVGGRGGKRNRGPVSLPISCSEYEHETAPL